MPSFTNPPKHLNITMVLTVIKTALKQLIRKTIVTLITVAILRQQPPLTVAMMVVTVGLAVVRMG